MAEWTPPTWFGVATGVSWRVLVIAAALLTLVSGLIVLGIIVLPTILGLFLATVLSPLYDKLRERRWKPGLAAFACLLLVAVSIGLLVYLAFTALVEPWNEISSKLSAGADEVVRRVNNQFTDGSVADTTSSLRRSTGDAVDVLVHGAVSVVSVTAAIVSTILLSLLVLFFFLKDGTSMWGAVSSLGGRRARVLDRTGRKMLVAVRSFLVGTAAVAAVDAVGIGLGAVILGVPSAISIAVITFFLAFIPYFGAIFGGVIACLIALSDEGLEIAIAMAVVVLVVQQVESNVLQPFLVGHQTKLHPLVVALSVIAGGAIAGVLGMFLAIPLIAAGVAAVNELRLAAAEPATDLG